MKASDLREKSDEELLDLERQVSGELFKLRMKHYSGQLQRVTDIKDRRRQVARIKTILHARKCGVES
jgi:large subunit ribosomal protein L29